MNEATLEEICRRGTVEVVIDDYGYKGEGFVRLEDGWLSVPGALPGERVRVRVDAEEPPGNRRMFGTVLDVLEASEARTDPRCERDSICRGCQLRHATTAEELRFKQRTVREVVEKFGDLPVSEQPDVDTITPWPIARGDAFRIRSRLNYRRGEDGAELGLHTPVVDGLITMSDCPALGGATRRLADYVETAFGQMNELPAGPDDPGPGIRRIEVGSPTFGRGLVDVRMTDVDRAEMLQTALKEAPVGEFLDRLTDRLPEDVGVAVASGEHREYVKSPRRVVVPILDLRLDVGYDDWFPATIAPAERVYERVLDWLEPADDHRFLDVGSGVGTISILVAPHVDACTGIDINRHSVEFAELNAVRNGRDNVEFLASGWEKALRGLAMDKRDFDIATINPMREPLGERPLAYLDKLGLERLVYLGPSPASAAKDIGGLREQGWTVDALAAANVHPATYHAMLVAKLVR